MASSEDPLSIHQTFNIDSWLNSDSDILSKALHRSITESSPFFDSNTDLSPPRTLSNVSFNSLPEIDPPPAVGTKRKRGGGLGVSNGVKPPKRKSRVSSSTKKSLTTFINADAANFRQMVQQVTGAKFIGGGGGGYGIPILKPEPHRLVAACGTLDTSSFLSNHHQQNVVTDLGSVSAPIDSFSHQSSAVNTTVKSGGGGGSAVEFDSSPCFPTLESWTVI